MRSTRSICQPVGSRMPKFVQTSTEDIAQGSGIWLRKPAPDDKQQGAEQHRGGGDVPDTCINRRWKRGWQAGIQYTFNAEIEPCDNSPRRIDDRGNAGVGGTNHRQAFLDRAQPRLLQMLIGA